MATKSKSKKSKSKSKKSKSKSTVSANLAEQPAMAKLIGRCKTGRGATVEQLAKHLGGVETHTVRSMLSRLAKAGVSFSKEREGRTVIYSA